MRSFENKYLILGRKATNRTITLVKKSSFYVYFDPWSKLTLEETTENQSCFQTIETSVKGTIEISLIEFSHESFFDQAIIHLRLILIFYFIITIFILKNFIWISRLSSYVKSFEQTCFLSKFLWERKYLFHSDAISIQRIKLFERSLFFTTEKVNSLRRHTLKVSLKKYVVFLRKWEFEYKIKSLLISKGTFLKRFHTLFGNSSKVTSFYRNLEMKERSRGVSEDWKRTFLDSLFFF